jgi:hypothetical protein
MKKEKKNFYPDFGYEPGHKILQPKHLHLNHVVDFMSPLAGNRAGTKGWADGRPGQKALTAATIVLFSASVVTCTCYYSMHACYDSMLTLM